MDAGQISARARQSPLGAARLPRQGSTSAYEAGELCRTLKIDLQAMVRLPRGEILQEWLAFNIHNLFRYTTALFNVFKADCTAETCPSMSVGKGIEYLWVDIEIDDAKSQASVVDYQISEPQVLPARDHIIKMLAWVRETLESRFLFPKEPADVFQPYFIEVCSRILRRLLRVFQHLYDCHFDIVRDTNCLAHVNTCCRYIVLFGQEFDLLTDEDLEPIEDLIRYWGYAYGT